MITWKDLTKLAEDTKQDSTLSTKLAETVLSYLGQSIEDIEQDLKYNTR